MEGGHPAHRQLVEELVDPELPELHCIAVDGAGTAWIANYRSPGISVFAGEGASVPGAALSAAGGWGADLSLVEAYGIAVDAAGDVWVSSSGDNRLIKFVGAAAPVQTPLLGGVRLP